MESARPLETRSAKQKKTPVQKKSKTQIPKCRKDSKRSVDLEQQKGKITLNKAARSDLSKVCDIFNQKQLDISSETFQANQYDLNTEKSTNNDETKRLIKEVSQMRYNSGLNINKTDQVTCKIEFTQETSSELEPVKIEENFCIPSIEDDQSPKLSLALEEVSFGTLKNKIDESKNSKVVNTGKSTICRSTKYLVCDNSQDCNQTDIYNDVGYLTSESFSNYLQDEGNSQEPEEELLKYFKDPVNSGQKAKGVSQLRLLLEQDIPDVPLEKFDKPSERDTGFCEEMPLENKEPESNDRTTTIQKGLPQLAQKTSLSSSITGSNTRRRVSFEKASDSFPQSPNNQRKNFSFTPISPRPPTVHKSITNSSPFVFPRETVYRGKHPPVSAFNIQQHIAQSATQASGLTCVPVSAMKTARPSSSSSTPSPVIVRYVAPQETSRDQGDSLISPSSSSGVFLSPTSPMSSCNSPVFTYRKSMSPTAKQPEEKPPPKTSSLLQSLLLTGKCPAVKTVNGGYSRLKRVDEDKTDILAINVLPFSNSLENSFRSQSVPVGLPVKLAVSPSSDTHPFPLSVSRCKELPSLKFGVEDLNWDSVLNTGGDELLMNNGSDSEESTIQTEGGKVTMESVISSVYEILSDKVMKDEIPTRPGPDTPPIYNDSSNSSRDPVVSAFPVSTSMKSFASAPVVDTNRTPKDATPVANLSAKRNIMPLLENLGGEPLSEIGLSDDLDSLEELSNCPDAFNDLAKEVAGSDELKE